MKIAILGYAHPLVGQWDSRSITTGLMGSEEAVVYAVQSLQKLGHVVHVYMNPPPDKEYNWFHFDWWDNFLNKHVYELTIMWRRLDVEAARSRSRLVYFWGHDSPRDHFVFPNFDRVLVLSYHHLNQYIEKSPNVRDMDIVIAGNGVVLEQFPLGNVATNIHSLGYFSNYARGLEVLINMWPEIRGRYPTATLDICYGRETWGTMPQKEWNDLLIKIISFRNNGVTEHGKVGHKELAGIMRRVKIFAYPCTTDTETFCITALKAQMAQMIPVTTRIGALNEVLIDTTPYIPLVYDISDYKTVLFKVMDNLKTDERFYEDLCFKERQHASKWTWDYVVSRWLSR